MLDTIKLLLEQGIALLREGQQQRSQFFAQIVEPIHVNFAQLVQRHDATFKHVLNELASESVDLKRLSDEVKNRLAGEARDWLLFPNLSSRPNLNKRSELDKAFETYLRTIDTCVLAIHGGKSIVFYGGLLSALEHSWLFDEKAETKQERRERLLEAVRDINAHYGQFCATVQAEYLHLRQKCMIGR